MTNKEEPRVIDTVLRALEERVCKLESIIRKQYCYTLTDLANQLMYVRSEAYCYIDGFPINDVMTIYSHGDYFLAFNVRTDDDEQKPMTSLELYNSIEALSKKTPNMITNRIYKAFDYASSLKVSVVGITNPDSKHQIHFTTTQSEE